MKSIWIARDKDGSLYLYEEKPVRIDCGDYWSFRDLDDNPICCEIDGYLFPELTWDSEPIELVIKEKEE